MVLSVPWTHNSFKALTAGWKEASRLMLCVVMLPALFCISCKTSSGVYAAAEFTINSTEVWEGKRKPILSFADYRFSQQGGIHVSNLEITHKSQSNSSWKFSGSETVCELKYADFEHALRHGQEKDESPLRAGIIQTALAGVSSRHWAWGTAELLGEGKGACTEILQQHARQRKFEKVVPAILACLVATALSLTRLCQ